MRIALVWIWLYSLPNEYWDSEILEDLGNCLGKFIKNIEQTNIQHYTSYAHICAYMNLSKELPEAIRMIWDDEDFLQNPDSEQIPFRCHRCHEYGHLFQEYPMNEPKKKPGKEVDQVDLGFTKVASPKRGNRKQDHQEIHKKMATSNPFEFSGHHEGETLEI